MDNELSKIEATKPVVLIPLKDLAKAYLEARDIIKAADEKYEADVTPVKEAKKEIQEQMIKIFKDRGEFSTRIEGATIALSVKKTAKITNEELLVKYLMDEGLKDYLEVRPNDYFKEAVMKNIEEVSEMPGIFIQETEFVSARKNKKDDPRQIINGDFQSLKGK